MALFDNIGAKFANAQRTLARIQGLDTTQSETNIIVNGASYIGTFGAAQISDVISVGGGYRRVSRLPVTITRGQFTAPPASKQKAIRTDISPAIEYLIDDVDVNDTHHYTLLLVKNGA